MAPPVSQRLEFSDFIFPLVGVKWYIIVQGDLHFLDY